VAELTSFNPAQRFGLLRKGDIAPGLDADLVLVDPNRSFVVRAKESESMQATRRSKGWSSRAGRIDIPARLTHLRTGEILGEPRGEYLHRPC